MVSKWIVIFYRNDQQISEIDNYLDNLTVKQRAKVESWIAQLEENGPTLTRPYADLLRNGIHELRITINNMQQERILYFFVYSNYIILTHAFTKKTKKVPDAEINKAIKIREVFLKRFKNIETLKKHLS